MGDPLIPPSYFAEVYKDEEYHRWYRPRFRVKTFYRLTLDADYRRMTFLQTLLFVQYLRSLGYKIYR